MKDPRMDGTLGAVGERVARAKPLAMEIERDLVGAAMECLRAKGARRLAVPHRRTTALAFAALLVLAVGAAWIVQKRGEPGRLLALAEAATLATPSHVVQSIYQGDGKLVERAEVWSGPEGDSYVDGWTAGESGRQLSLERKREKIQWTWGPTKTEYQLHWSGSGMGEHTADALGSAERAVRKAADYIDMGGVQLGGLQLLAIAQIKASDGKLTVREAWGNLEGKDVRIIEISATPGQRGQSAPGTAMKAWYYLTPDGSRLVRQVTTFLPAGTPPFTVDAWPIEYDTELPASVFDFQIPEGAAVTFEGEKIKPVWESMDGAEKQQIRETVLGLGRAWAAGDADGFCKYYDFAAGLEYGVKGKFTAKWLRAYWTDMVRRQARRWREDQVFFDYAFGTAKPPSEALAFWSIYPGPPVHGDHWVVYGATPSTEPGIMVLARERVVDRRGAVQEHGTHMFLRKIAGRYRVILWRPPFD